MKKETQDKLVTLFMIAALFAFAIFALGCAENEIRITEYGGSGAYIPFAGGKVGGCRIIQNGEVDVEIHYIGERCTVSK